VVATIPVAARFDNQLQLNSIDVLDSSSQPGGTVRLRLKWQALTAISKDYKVFVHLFAGDQIVTQHDGQPVGELRPTSTWKVGEDISDQFAMTIPADTPSGNYQLRIGLYDPNTQVRLPVLLADGSSAEFFVGGLISIK
jgi:hypothetical protein